MKLFAIAIGIVVLAVGVAMVGFGLYGLLKAPAMAAAEALERAYSCAQYDSDTWQRRWILWSVGMGAEGLATAVAGVAIALRKRWGTLLLACTAAVFGLLPWIWEWTGAAIYEYERAELKESVVYLAISAMSLLAFRKWHDKRRA